MGISVGKICSQKKRFTIRSLAWVYIILSIVAGLMFLNPFAAYTYNGGRYTVTGLDFVTGKTVCGGKVVITTEISFIVALAGLLLIILGSALISVISEKISFRLIALGALVNMVCQIKYVLGIQNIFRRAKSPRVGYGWAIAILLIIVVLITSLYVLWRMKILCTLDFMALPGMLYFIIDRYIPMLGISIAFKKVDYSLGIWKSPWVGLENFKMLFAHKGSLFDSDAFIITRNTLLYNLLNRTLQKFFQTSILLPQLVSMVIVAYIVFGFLGNETGLINNLLKEPISFYQETKYWPFILVFVYIWKQVGYNSIIFLAAIVSIDKRLYEASKVDGAKKWQQIFYVTLPMLKSTMITLMLLQVGRIFYSDFGLFYQVPLDSGALYNVTNTVDTYVYRSLMVLNNVSIASAGSTYQAIVGFVLVFCVNFIVKKIDGENALF